MFFFASITYFLQFSSKLLFAIARYSVRYSLLASEKNTPLFGIARYLKPCRGHHFLVSSFSYTFPTAITK